MDRGTWRATVHEVTKSQIRLGSPISQAVCAAVSHVTPPSTLLATSLTVEALQGT